MNATLTVRYPAIHPGSAETTIEILSGAPDLLARYAPGRLSPARRCFVTDTAVAALPAVAPFVAAFSDGVCGNDICVIIEAGEAYKTPETALRIVKAALQANFTRADCFVGIGGGVVTDMTGFAAAIFKRGVPCEFVPTTLLAMADAAIGGKTGCDLDEYKNMIGAFYPAARITMYPAFVQSLSEREYRSGLAEAIKTALLFDAEAIASLKSGREAALARDAESVLRLITRSAQAKARIVEKDFTEKNERMFLNLGHTFGHALESVAGLGRITHGEAVAWGIARAAAVSARRGFCTRRYADDVAELLAAYGYETAALPRCADGIPEAAEKIIAAMHKDKKNATGAVRLMLQRGPAQNLTAEVSDGDIRAALA